MGEVDAYIDDPRRISNSETSAWFKCKTSYYFAFVMKIEKIKRSEALTRGIIGHEILADYYSVLKETKSHDTAVHSAQSFMLRWVMDNPDDTNIVMELKTLLERYWGYWGGHPDWEILHVEDAFDLEITADFQMPMRLDLLVKEVSTGRIYLVDHKFCYDFWSQDDITLSPQFAKYVAALKANGINVDGCLLNQIRYRKMKDPDPTKYFKMTADKPSQSRINVNLSNHVKASLEITDYRNLPEDQMKAATTQVLNKMVCKSCDFKQLCISQLDGGELEFAIETEFQPNTYDYNKGETSQDGLM
jgi:CRISPR/Cas system-associated exonuclease Cas4 (RecB family)